MRVLLVGGGNITRSRHIPALNSLGYEIVGVVGTDKDALSELNKRYSLKTTLLHKDCTLEKALENYELVDFAIIGVPPHEHFSVAKVLLNRGVSCLVEKPLCVKVEEADELIRLAQASQVKLGVMHNFSMSRSFLRLKRYMLENRLGHLKSISLFQASSMNRRIPPWIDQLPGGLFFDEAAHFIYFARTIAGKVSQDSISAVAFGESGCRTPRTLTSTFLAGDVPVSMQLTLDSPISEWFASFFFEKAVVNIDLFRDILITIKEDREHYALDILRTSLSATLQHWLGFACSGLKLITGNLHYGIDLTIKTFAEEESGYPTGLDGRENVQTILDIINRSKLV